jgi:hypothetical protein
VAQTSRNSKKRRCQRPIRLHVTYELNMPAKVRMTFKHLLPGRLVNGGCQRPTAQNGNAPACFRMLAVAGALTTSGSQGTDTSVFNGQVSGETLRPGCYRLTATPNAKGQAGAPQTTAFRIAAPPWPCQNSNLATKNTA